MHVSESPVTPFPKPGRSENPEDVRKRQAHTVSPPCASLPLIASLATLSLSLPHAHMYPSYTVSLSPSRTHVPLILSGLSVMAGHRKRKRWIEKLEPRSRTI